MKRPELIHGEFFRQCDRSGFRVLSSQTRQEWTGAWVYSPLWEPRQPQDMVRGIKDQQNVEFARPKTEPRYLETNAVSRNDL